jgi:hypothetical protein
VAGVSMTGRSNAGADDKRKDSDFSSSYNGGSNDGRSLDSATNVGGGIDSGGGHGGEADPISAWIQRAAASGTNGSRARSSKPGSSQSQRQGQTRSKQGDNAGAKDRGNGRQTSRRRLRSDLTNAGSDAGPDSRGASPQPRRLGRGGAIGASGSRRRNLFGSAVTNSRHQASIARERQRGTKPPAGADEEKPDQAGVDDEDDGDRAVLPTTRIPRNVPEEDVAVNSFDANADAIVDAGYGQRCAVPFGFDKSEKTKVILDLDINDGEERRGETDPWDSVDDSVDDGFFSRYRSTRKYDFDASIMSSGVLDDKITSAVGANLSAGDPDFFVESEEDPGITDGDDEGEAVAIKNKTPGKERDLGYDVAESSGEPEDDLDSLLAVAREGPVDVCELDDLEEYNEGRSARVHDTSVPGSNTVVGFAIVDKLMHALNTSDGKPLDPTFKGFAAHRGLASDEAPAPSFRHTHGTASDTVDESQTVAMKILWPMVILALRRLTAKSWMHGLTLSMLSPAPASLSTLQISET